MSLLCVGDALVSQWRVVMLRWCFGHGLWCFGDEHWWAFSDFQWVPTQKAWLFHVSLLLGSYAGLILKSKGIDFQRPHLFWTRQAWHQITLKGLNPESCLANIANPSAQSNVRSMISKIVGSHENKVYAKQLFPEFNCYDMCSSQGQNKSWMWRQANPNRPWWGPCPMAWQFFLTSPDASKAQVRISTALCSPQHPFSASSSASSSPQRGFKNSSV